MRKGRFLAFAAVGALFGAIPATAQAKPDFDTGSGREGGLPPRQFLSAGVIGHLGNHDGREAAMTIFDATPHGRPSERAEQGAGPRSGEGYQHTIRPPVPYAPEVVVHLGNLAPTDDDPKEPALHPDGASAPSGKPDPAAMHRIPWNPTVLQHLQERTSPDATSATGAPQARLPGAHGNGNRESVLAVVRAAMTVPMPGWMLTRLQGGEGHVAFDDPKTDRLGVAHLVRHHADKINTGVPHDQGRR